ncbi:MAG: hypothetical protein E5299_00186 [Burkholderia gladioli]|nr:MAG: hypothetical protein E5299_00186 [Burkholderia gladioli]
MASTGIISGDTNGLRTSEVRHAVDYADANGNPGRLRLDLTRPETVAGEHFEPIHRILGKRSPVVATVLLPFSTTGTGNCINRAVMPGRTGRIRWSMSVALLHKIERDPWTFTRTGRGAGSPIKSDFRVTA